MTAHIGTKSIDGTPISATDMARIEAEEVLHAKQQRAAVRVVASASLDTDDCRMLLSILGLDGEPVVQAHAELVAAPAAKPTRKRRAA